MKDFKHTLLIHGVGSTRTASTFSISSRAFIHIHCLNYHGESSAGDVGKLKTMITGEADVGVWSKTGSVSRTEEQKPVMTLLKLPLSEPSFE